MTNAFFGMINLITKRERNIKGTELSGETSSYHSHKGRLTYRIKFQSGLEFIVSGAYYSSRLRTPVSHSVSPVSSRTPGDNAGWHGDFSQGESYTSFEQNM
jgi:hypothetical protein